MTRPRAWQTSRWSAIVPRRSPQARRARPRREPAGSTVTSSKPSSGLAAPTSEPPPNAPVTATITCQASPSKTCSPSARTLQRSGCSETAARTRADGVGERAEPRLERLGAAGGGRGEPGARDVDERAAVGEAAELHRAQLAAGGGQRAAASGVGRQLAGAREVVGGAGGDDRERHAEAARELRGGADACRRRRPPPRARAPSRRRARGPSGSQPKARTSAPWRRIASASGSVSRPPPEAALAISAIRTRAQATGAGV